MIDVNGVSAATLAVLLSIALAVVNALFGWVVKTLFDQLSAMRADHSEFDKRLQDLEVRLPTSYVSKDDFKTAIFEVRRMLDKIYDKLDHKVDK